MIFKNRKEAGILLTQKLKKYRHKDIVVYAIPRGGIVPAVEIAQYFSAPLDLVITRKIGHQYNHEYAIAAIDEYGNILGSKKELSTIDPKWFEKTIAIEQREIKRRRSKYLHNESSVSITNKIVILVDDGIATGFTMHVAIQQLRQKNPQKIVVAIPIIPQSTFDVLQQKTDDVIALNVASDETFLGAVGAYYEKFPPVTDNEVIAILTSYKKNSQNYSQTQTVFK